MKGLPEHDEVEAALRGVPVFERGDLDGDSLTARDFGHSRIRLNRKHIDSLSEKLLGRDPGARANVEHRSSALHQKVVDELGGVARPTRFVDSRRGTEGVRARTVEEEICTWLHTRSLRAAPCPATESGWASGDFPASGYDAVVLAPAAILDVHASSPWPTCHHGWHQLEDSC
jgi:hypothetical protein